MKKIMLAVFLIIGFVNGAYATDIQLTWETPTQYEDGKALTAIDGYNIYHVIDNVAQIPIQVEATRNSYLLANVAPGSYTFQISTVSQGLEAVPSDPVNVQVSNSRPVKIELTVRVVE